MSKLNGKKVGSKHVVVRYAKHVDPEEYEKPKPKIEIPVLAAGSSINSKSASDKQSKIMQIEERLKQMQQTDNDLIINKTVVASNENPLIKKYQFNKGQPNQSPASSGSSMHQHKSKYTNKKHVKRKQY